MKISKLLLAAMALSGACGAVNETRAEVLNGYWHATSIDRGAPLGEGQIVGIIVPDYSENEFVAFYMFCSPSRRVVVVSQDTGDSARPRSTTVPLLIDGKKTPLAAKPDFSDAADSWSLDATVGYATPTLRAIIAAKSLGLAGSPMTERFPTAKYRMAMNSWAQRCGLR